MRLGLLAEQLLENASFCILSRKIATAIVSNEVMWKSLHAFRIQLY